MVQAGQATANHGWQWLHGQSMVCHGQVIESKNQGHKLWSKRMVTMQCQPWFSHGLTILCCGDHDEKHGKLW